MMNKQVLIFILLFFTISSNKPIHLLPQIQTKINKAIQNLWNEIQTNENLWNMLPTLGSMFLSEYYFELKALNVTRDLKHQTKFDINYFKDKLIQTQEEDGSWNLAKDLNRVEGSLDATIFNYWFLKDVGLSESTETMKKARKFVLDHGGIENSQVMTRFKLAVFGQYQWHLLPYIPLFLFKSNFIWSFTYIKDYVAQWVYPHLIPLSYMRYHKIVFSVSVCLSQLRVSRSDYCEQTINKINKQNVTLEQQNTDVSLLIEELAKLKGPKGLFGAYTVSSMLALIVLKDYSLRYVSNDVFDAFYKKNLNETLQMVESIEINSKSPYEGSLVDGRYWDTLLAVYALLESGQNPQKLHPIILYLITKAVQNNGGIPYGVELQYAPDIDDTSILLILYGKMKKYYKNQGNKGQQDFYQKQIQRSYKWLQSNQNDDGGFPAFDKGKNDNQHPIFKLLFKLTGIDKSAQIFDPSCSDITGHFLEGIGECALYQTQTQLQTINQAIDYLFSTKKERMWIGRWGINYIYGVGAVIPGLARIGYNMSQQWIKDVILKLKQIQHQDGGFGENSESYNNDKFMNGVSTASMTAWGLLAYIEMGQYMDLDDNIERAVKYLLKNFDQNDGKFFDRSVVGTGHRGVLNLQYPMYAYSFPLIALSRARAYIKGEWKHTLNQKLNETFLKYNAAINGQL